MDVNRFRQWYNSSSAVFDGLSHSLYPLLVTTNTTSVYIRPMNLTIVGYPRGSSREQTEDSQALEQQCDRLYQGVAQRLTL